MFGGIDMSSHRLDYNGNEESANVQDLFTVHSSQQMCWFLNYFCKSCSV